MQKLVKYCAERYHSLPDAIREIYKRERGDEIGGELATLLYNTIPAEQIDAFPIENTYFRDIHDTYDTVALTIAYGLLDIEVRKQRLSAMKLEEENGRLELLTNSTIDKNGLVNVLEFRLHGPCFERNGNVFFLFPVNNAANSSHWISNYVSEYSELYSTKIRLDPFEIDKSEGHYCRMLAMHVYGRQLNWGRIANLKEMDHGKWLSNDSIIGEGVTTEYCWSPDEREVHFSCEELPIEEELSYRGSRYFHSIFNRETMKLCHVDGATRIYSQEELRTRKSTHIRDAGKIGTRRKLFSVDSDRNNIETQHWTNLFASFYVWNEDAQHYAENAT